LRAGAALCYRKQHREPPIDRDVRVLHRDPALLVVEKPAHLPVHGDGAFVRHTLIHLLRHELGHPEARIVHRLDRETSGLLVVARTDAARAALERQFVAGSVGKSYLAVVHGAVERDFVCDAPIGRATTSSITLRRAAAANARDPKPASTRFTVLERGRDRTLLGCEPATGRTHQIRVHLEHVGHPLLGDKLYGRTDAEYLAFVARVKAGGDPREVPPGEPPRQLLHAAALAFRHPDDERALRFESAAPAEFGAWLARSSQGDSARPTGQGQQG
ncbi:MAG: RluA family pseudouridine synthase, partial [Planctomycetes bacterium]|nr:RluA family pseudouridine synthase [Planctomycetota bacterium]